MQQAWKGYFHFITNRLITSCDSVLAGFCFLLMSHSVFVCLWTDYFHRDGVTAEQERILETKAGVLGFYLFNGVKQTFTE